MDFKEISISFRNKKRKIMKLGSIKILDQTRTIKKEHFQSFITIIFYQKDGLLWMKP